ncbi:MAG: DUF4157 domain-containing protein [Deltaproteobacteria bacterium]|nr:DUF4157 domain-containing protein [Deltaproteobacteria bacterium]
MRHRMEQFFGVDLGAVRVHVGQQAAAVGALAFTAGDDVYFAPGQYDPLSREGLALLGHELTHVVQQREGRVTNPLDDTPAVVFDPALESEADHMGGIVSSSTPRSTYATELARLGIQRKSSLSKLGRITQRAIGHELIVGAYMHEDKTLPPQLEGHAFVSFRDPSGRQESFGFSPQRFGEYDLGRDVPKLSAGVQGVVHNDVNAFTHRDVRARRFVLSPAQWQAARRVVDGYRDSRFELDGRQCVRFAADVARAANVRDFDRLPNLLPRSIYAALDGSKPFARSSSGH